MERYTTEELLQYINTVSSEWDRTHISRRLKYYRAIEELERRGVVCGI